MRRSAARVGLLISVIAPLAGVGCQIASSGVRLLSFIGLEKHPLSVALVTDKPAETAQTFNPFAPYRPLQKALSDDLRRPVAVDVCFRVQGQMGLASGWYDVVVVSPAQLAAMDHPETARVLAASVDKQGRIATAAFLVVAADSDLQGVEELRGKTVAFGPTDDSRTHFAALKLLRDAGLQPGDLALDLLPIPGGLRHFPDGRSVAQAVLSGSAAAGFVDEEQWDALVEHEERAGEPARDKLRVVGRTVALPGKLFVAGQGLDQPTADRIRSFLLAIGTAHPEVMEPLPSSGYALPAAELLATCCQLLPPAVSTQPAR